MSHRISRALLRASLFVFAPAIAAAAPHPSVKSEAAKSEAAKSEAAEPPSWKAYAYTDVKLSFEAPKPPKVTHDGGSNDLSADYTIAEKAGVLTVSAVDYQGVSPRPPTRDAADTAGEIYRAKPKVTPANIPGDLPGGATALDWSIHTANGTDILGRTIDAGRFQYRVSAVLTYADTPDPAAKARAKEAAERFIKSVAVTP
jgi:hypothetical protein